MSLSREFSDKRLSGHFIVLCHKVEHGDMRSDGREGILGSLYTQCAYLLIGASRTNWPIFLVDISDSISP